MDNLSRSVVILAMAGTAFLWSIAGLFIKVLDWNPIARAGTRSLIAVMEPVFNPVWVFFAIGEAPGIHALIGSGIFFLQSRWLPLSAHAGWDRENVWDDRVPLVRASGRGRPQMSPLEHPPDLIRIAGRPQGGHEQDLRFVSG
jgi:hypothetical protein